MFSWTSLVLFCDKMTESVDEGKLWISFTLTKAKLSALSPSDCQHADKVVMVKVRKRNLAGHSDCKSLMVHALSGGQS